MQRFRGLFFKAVCVLILISLVPIGLIGFHFTRVNSRILQNEILQREKALASRITYVIRAYSVRIFQFFSVFIKFHTDSKNNILVAKEDLQKLIQHQPAIVSVSLIDDQGKVLVTTDSLAQYNSYQNQFLPMILATSIKQRANYFSNLPYSFEGKNYAVLGFPIKLKSGRGALVAHVNLSELEQILWQTYPLEMDVLVVSGSDKIIFQNGSNNFSAQNNLSEQEFLTLLNNELGTSAVGTALLPKSKKILVASENLLLPSWKVFVFQPANTTSRLFIETTIRSDWEVALLILIMVLFVVGVSYLVINPITRPLNKLRKAMLNMQKGKLPSAAEIEIPNNEIGDLSKGFMEMTDSLNEREKELLSAQMELANLNQQLEKKIEKRTQELKKANAELVKSERLAAIGQLASIISHEIRNPLAVISNATRLISMLQTTPSAKIQRQIEIIQTEIKQANGIISEVLGYARTREQILTLINLNSLLKEICFSYPLEKGVSLQEEIEEESVNVKIDCEEIKQAILNLMVNAVQAMSNKGVLTVGLKAGKKVACIYIKDTGPGIPPEIRSKIMSPFFTTKARGTGLGLAVVGKVVKRHKGKFFIHTEMNKGTCCQIYLKIYKKAGDTCYGEIS